MKNKKNNLFKSKVYDFLNLFVTQKIENKSQNIYYYGENNLFPNDLIKIIAESGTATACINKVSQFIEADGFVNPEVSNMMVNKTQTADVLLSIIGNCWSYFGSVSLYITRRIDGGIAEVTYLPFNNIRKTLDGNFSYNKNYGNKYFKLSENKIYPSFKKAVLSTFELKKQIEAFGEVGEVFYFNLQKVGQETYSIPQYYAGIEDIKTDAELSKFEYETAVNSFITSAILTIVGEVDNTVKDDNGKTDQDYLDETLKEFTGSKKNSSGMSGRNKLTVLSARTKEEVPVLQSFDSKSIMDAASGATDRITRKVARLFEVPPLLIGIESATGFNTKALVDQIDLFNKTINKIQRIISGIFKTLYPHIEDFTISTFSPINYIPDQVWEVLTAEEKRAIGGYKPLEDKTTENSNQVINGVNSLSPLVANKVLESMTANEIRALVGLPFVTETTTPITK